MITAVIAFAARALGPRFARFAAPLVYAAMLVAALGGFMVLKSCYDRSVVERARVEGNAKALKEQAKADEQAAVRRGADRTRAATEAEQLKETVDEAVEQGRDPRAAYYECVRLQQSARAAHRPAPAC